MDLYELIKTLEQSMFSGNVGGANLLGINKYVEYLTTYAHMLAAIIMIIFVGSKVILYFVNPSGNFDPYVLVKPILILAAIALYQPLVEFLLVKPVNIITQIVDQGALYVTNNGNIDNLNSTFEDSMSHIEDSSTNEDGTEGDGIYAITSVSENLELLHLIIYFVATCVTAFMLFKQLIYKAIYFILGIFVLPLSLAPGNQEILKKWFYGFISTLLWIPIISILKVILVIVQRNAQGGFGNILFSVALQLVMIITILSVPKFANLLVSTGSDISTSIMSSYSLNNMARSGLRTVGSIPRRFMKK
ncbi:hypothetical protein ACE939_06850 [Aquimarina sp. W85]|uniref:hypothetical protein n=1 Tax=Aquimarina rhodophyticola TaxID=3342246 RepID=UPI00366B25B3